MIGFMDPIRFRQIGKMDVVLIEPFPIGAARADLLLDFFVVDDATLDRIDQEHATGLEAAFLLDVLRFQRQYAHFRGHDDHVIVCNDVTAGPQPVAVQRAAYQAAIGEDHGGGTIPRFHQRGVIFVKRLFGFRHVDCRGPCLGD